MRFSLVLIFLLTVADSGVSSAMGGDDFCNAGDIESCFLYGFDELRSGDTDSGIECLKIASKEGHYFSGVLLSAYYSSIGDTTGALYNMPEAGSNLEGLVIAWLGDVKKALYPESDSVAHEVPSLDDWLSGDPYDYIEAAKWLNKIILGDNNQANRYASSYKGLSKIAFCSNSSSAKKGKELILSALTDEEKGLMETRLNIEIGSGFAFSREDCKNLSSFMQ